MQHLCSFGGPQKMPEIVVAAAATGPSAPASRCSYCDCLLGSWNGLALALCLRELYQLHHTLTLICPLGLPFNDRILQSLTVHVYAHAAIAPKSYNSEQASSCISGRTNMQDLPLRTIDADAPQSSPPSCSTHPSDPTMHLRTIERAPPQRNQFLNPGGGMCGLRRRQLDLHRTAAAGVTAP